MTSLVVRGATVVTQDERRRVLRDVDVVVQDGRIVEVGKARAEADHRIDGRDRVLVPGLVNAHTHLAMGLFRGYGDDMLLESWLQERIWPAEDRMTAGDMRVGARLGLLEMVAGGTTAFLDMYFMQDAVAEECLRAGVRAHLGEGMVDVGKTPKGEAHAKLRDFYPSFIREWTKRGDGLVVPAVTPHAAYTCGPETLRASADLAKQHGLVLSTHCSETRKEIMDVEAQTGRRPVPHLEATGLLGERTVLAHCGWVTKEEVGRFAATGTKVAHCPVSNMKLATGGNAPLPEMAQAGVTVGLGTDGAASNNTVDMFETMKFTALLHKHLRWDATVVPAQAALDMATRGGAAALGLGERVGSIEVGKEADFFLLDLRRPHLVPRYDVVSHLVYAARSPDVSTTVVRGRPVYRERAFPGMDAARVMDDAQATAERLTASPPAPATEKKGARPR